MRTGTYAAVVICILLAASCPLGAQAQEIPSPVDQFGFRPGDDGRLIEYGQLVEYLMKLDIASERVLLKEVGESPLGRKMYLAFISSPENITALDKLRDINERLALDPRISDDERDKLLARGKVFILATLSMHSGEVGPSQALPLIAYEMATTEDPELLEWMDDVVYMATACHNPDGMDMIVKHYRKYHNTKYDGAAMPGVYHKYVGHDNNRDFVILSQKDTKVIAAIYSTLWYPQVMVEKHQMGSTGVRYYVPPNHDPIAENIDAGIWNWMGLFGMNMIKDMTGAGQSGVAQHYIFDNYWPGSTETCDWKNVIGFLTEAASARYATPIYIEPSELVVRGKGLSEYKKSINMPLPWPGGWWRLSDILQYEVVSTKSIIKTCSRHRRDILSFRNDLCRREVERGRTTAPFYYALPLDQHDRSETAGMVDLLIEHGVKVSRLSSGVEQDGIDLEKGDIIVPMAQPYRAFAKEVLESQSYPLRHYTPDGEIIRPYDITSWSLPLHMGVEAYSIDERSQKLESSLVQVETGSMYRRDLPADCGGVVFAAGDNESYMAAFRAMEKGMDVYRLRRSAMIGGREFAAGGFFIRGSVGENVALADLSRSLRVTPFFTEKDPFEEVPDGAARKIEVPRIALVETWFHDMDAGWTRFIFDTYHIPYDVLRPGDFSRTDLAKRYDVVIFPNNGKDILMTGKRKRGGDYYSSSYPPEYVKGIEKEGMEKLLDFLDGGGLIVSWGRSSELFSGILSIKKSKDDAEEFNLPFSYLGEQLAKDGFYCPGGLLRVILIPDHPLTWGMKREASVLFSRGTAFSTSLPMFDMDRRVIARFPEKGILVSGYAEREEKIAGRSAMIWLRKGEGQLVLFGFNPQFRASTAGTYKLLFNALLLGKASGIARPTAASIR